MKIHIMGASGAGSTTLGTRLAEHLDYPYFDTDEYFWQYSEIPFTIRRDADTRNTMIKNDLHQKKNYIVGGSVINWGTEWLNFFNLVIFLYIPREIRIDRLKTRDYERYGDRIMTDQTQAIKHKNFIDWAYGYDDNTARGRNLQAHQDWLTKLTCPVLEITGDTSVDDRLKTVITKINDMALE